MKAATGMIMPLFIFWGLGCGSALSGQQLQLAGPTSIPYGHLDYCQRNPADCRRHRVASPLGLTEARLQQLRQVNHSVNAAISAVSDPLHFGKRDYWMVPRDGKGDCEDYVLAKRARLLAAGLPASNLLITLVQGGEPHVVLTVRTNRGDYILDNLRADVLPLEATRYRYIKIQSPADAGGWVSVKGSTMLSPAL